MVCLEAKAYSIFPGDSCTLELCCIVASGWNCTPAVLVGVEWSCRTAWVPSDTAVLEQSYIAAGVPSDTADGGQWYTAVAELPLQPSKCV